MTESLPFWCQVGKFIDAKDSMNDWCMATVLSISLPSRTITVTMDGWGDKWNQTYPFKTSKLAPFRKQTKCYTGPKRKAYRDWEYSSTEMDYMHQTIDSLLSGTSENESAFEITQFYRGKLFIFIENLLVYDFKTNKDHLPLSVSFFSKTILLIVKWLKEAPKLFPYYYQGLSQPDLFLSDSKVALANVWPELLSTLNKLFALENRVSEFFLYYDEVPKDYEPVSITNLRSSNYSETLLYLINLFAKIGGFDAVLDIIRNNNDQSRVPFTFVNQILLYAINQFIDSEFSNKFFTEFTDLIFQRIKIISDSELKDLKYEEILSLLANMGKASGEFNNPALETNKLGLFLKMLKCNYLEKRIKGLTEINLVIESIEGKVIGFDNSKVKVSEKELEEWLITEGLISLILFERPHIELIKRSGPMLRFLARLERLEGKDLEILWESAISKHESYIRATYAVIVEIVPFLNESQNDFLFEHFSKIKLENYDEQFLQLIHDFSSRAIMTSSKAVEERGAWNEKWYGINILESLMLNSSPVNLCKLATKYLGNILNLDCCKKLIKEYKKKAVELIRKNDSVPQALKLLMKILSSNQEGNKKSYKIQKIQQQNNLRDLVIENLAIYMMRAKNTEMANERYSHEKNIKKRLLFIEFIYHLSERNIEILSSHLSTLWGTLIETGFQGNKESDMYFKWLMHGFKYGHPVNTQSAEELFNNNFLNENHFSSENVTPLGFECFKWLFINLNNYHRNIDAPSLRFKTRLSKDVVAIDKILLIQLNAKNDEISKEALKLLVGLLTRYHENLLMEAGTILNDFTNSLLTTILSNSESDQLVKRGLTLLRYLLCEDDDDDSGKTYSIYTKETHGKDYKQIFVNQNKNIRHLRKEVAKAYNQPLERTTLHIVDKVYGSYEDDIELKSLKLYWLVADFDEEGPIEFNAKQALSQNQELIKALFKLLSKADKHYSDLAWSLLVALPINEKLVEDLNRLEKPVQQLIDMGSMHQMLYCLNIILKLAGNQEWCEKFYKVGGTTYLTQIFNSPKETEGGKLIAMKEASMLIVLANLIKHHNQIEDAWNFASSLLGSFSLISKSIVSPGILADLEELFKAMRRLISVIDSNDGGALGGLLASVNGLLTSLFTECLINCPDPQYSSLSRSLLEEIFEYSGIHSQAYTELWGLTEVSINEHKKSSEFWELLANVIEKYEPEDNHLKNSVENLMTKIECMPGEKNSNEKDVVLCGIMKVLKSAWKKTKIEPEEKHRNLFLEKCLFEVPDKIDRHGINPPKCKHNDTRNCTFDLLIELCTHNQRFLDDLTNYLGKFHEEPQWRTSRRIDWNNSPAAKEKSLTGYVGLKNLGCTCYMNSLLQQLFMISTFRESILNTQVHTDQETLEESNLYQLQHIFSGLKSSDKMYINTKNFAKSFKDYDGNPINPGEQMDVDEFFGSFMDKLENQLQGTDYGNTIKNHFGGLQATELIGKDCVHRSERIEPFISIPVEVKTKKSLLEGLESYVAGEMLEGENAYQCDHCEAKVRAVRRVCVKHLPNYLVIALRRFEFDFDTMTRMKLNDYFEFPMELNMEPFTQEGLERAEKEKEKQAGKETVVPNKKFNDDYYNYKLRGIIIHSGTAESGHYYSYIFDIDQKKWFEFNDQWVTEINEGDIANECFGGEEKYSWSSYTSLPGSGMREKFGNGYLLFYERKGTYKSRSADDEYIETISLAVKEAEDLEHYKKIKSANQKYWRSRHIFGAEYSRFIKGLAEIDNTSDKFLIQFLLTILIRTKERGWELVSIYKRIENTLKANDYLCSWILEMICVQKIAKELIINNPMHTMRKLIVGLIKTCLKVVNDETKLNFFLRFIQLLPFATKKYSKNYAQYLEILKEAVFAVDSFIHEYNIIEILFNHLFRQTLQLPESPQFTYLDIYLGYDENDKSEEDIKEEMMFFSDAKGASNAHLYHLLYEIRNQLPPEARNFLKRPENILNVLKDIDSKLAARSIGKLYAELCQDDPLTSTSVFEVLEKLYQSAEYYAKARLIRAFSPLLLYNDTLQQSRIENFINFQFRNMSFCKYAADVEQIVYHIFKISTKSEAFRHIIMQKTNEMAWLSNWISSNMKMTYTTYKTPGVQQTEEYIRPTYRVLLSKCQKLSQGEAPNQEGEWDSDEDLGGYEFQPGFEVDVLDQTGQNYIKVKIEACVGELLWLSSSKSANADLWAWKDKQSEELAPHGSKSGRGINTSS